MKKMIVAAAILFGLVTSASAGAPKESDVWCHGHVTAEDKWTLNLSSWSEEEIAFVAKIDGYLSDINPTRQSNTREVAGVLDQFGCTGVSLGAAVKDMADLNISMLRLKLGVGSR